MRERIIELLSEYVSHASVSNNPEYAEAMRGSRDFVRRRLESLGFSVEEIPTPLHPILLAQRGQDHPGSEDWPHLMLYAHYDVQPPEPLNLWESPAFEAAVRGDRIYGRGAADNKGPFIVHTLALETLLSQEPDLPLRITYLVEGEEEIGSPNFKPFLDQYRDTLSEADFILISDTGGHSEDQLVVTTSLRGLTDLEVEVRGPSSDLHSGLFGGAILNPIQALADLCSSLHHTDGTINVPGFYEGIQPVADWEREELRKLGLEDSEFQHFLGAPALRPPRGFSALEAIRFQPTLEFNGIQGGYQGPGPKTVIPSVASCKITCRLVADQDPGKVQEAVARTIEERAPEGVAVTVKRGSSGNPYLIVPPNRPNTPPDQSQILQTAFSQMDRAVEQHFGKPPLYLREGGSIPIVAELQRVAGLDSILLGLYTSEDRMHAPNESFHLGIAEKAVPAFTDLFKGIAGLRNHD